MKFSTFFIIVLFCFALTPLSCFEGSVDQTKKSEENSTPDKTEPVVEDEPQVEVSSEDIRQVEKNIIFHASNEQPGTNDEIFRFTHIRIDQTLSKGTLPPVVGKRADKPGDTTIRKMVFAGEVEDDIREIRGFLIESLYAPKRIEGFPPRPLEQIEVTLEMGKVEDVDFSGTWDGSVTDSEKPSDPENKLEDIFTKRFVLRPDQLRQYWSFDKPIVVNAKKGDAFQLTMRIEKPELDPTTNIIEPDRVRLVINNRFLEQNVKTLVDPQEEKRISACYASPRGQFVCLYTSGVAWFYVVAPFGEAAFFGSWENQGDNTIVFVNEDKKISINNKRPDVKVDFGIYGKNYVIKKSGDERLNPYYDLVQELGTKAPRGIKDVKSVTLTQIARGGEPEAVLVLKNGNFAVFERPDKFSRFKLIKFVESKEDVDIRIMFIPGVMQSVVAIKGADFPAWMVHSYDAENNFWARFYRSEVPWDDDVPEPRHPPIPLDPSENMSPQDIKYKQEQERLAKEKAEREAAKEAEKEELEKKIEKSGTKADKSKVKRKAIKKKINKSAAEKKSVKGKSGAARNK